MPPKKQPVEGGVSLEEISKLLDEKLTNINTKLDNVLVNQAAVEKRVNTCETDIQILQQRERSHNLRILGLKLSSSETPSPFGTAGEVYNLLVEPILKLAVAETTLIKVPSMWECFDACHVLPAKKDQIPAIHVRFQSKMIRELILTKKGQFFKTSEIKCSIYENLSPANRTLLRQTKEREDVERAWTRNGRIKFMLKNCQEVYTAKQ